MICSMIFSTLGFPKRNWKVEKSTSKEIRINTCYPLGSYAPALNFWFKLYNYDLTYFPSRTQDFGVQKWFYIFCSIFWSKSTQKHKNSTKMVLWVDFNKKSLIKKFENHFCTSKLCVLLRKQVKTGLYIMKRLRCIVAHPSSKSTIKEIITLEICSKSQWY
jgi:hypothetical protein